MDEALALSLLRAGWQSAEVPATGKFYFYNTSTSVVEWELPGINAVADPDHGEGGPKRSQKRTRKGKKSTHGKHPYKLKVVFRLCLLADARVEMNGWEEQADNAKALYWKPLSWLGTIRPTSANDAFDPALWKTFFTTTIGLEVPVLSCLLEHKPRLVVSHSTCPPLSPSPLANSFLVGTAVINNNRTP